MKPEDATFNVQSAQLHPLPVGGIFFRWNVDLAGPFATVSALGNHYIFVAVESLSKYLVAVPIPNKISAVTTATFEQRILTVFGNCALLVTDNGTEFQGVFDDLCQWLKIDHRHTSAHCPQSDGQAERAV